MLGKFDRRVIWALVSGSVLALALLGLGMAATGSLGDYYLAPNLLLAYIPLLLTYLLLKSLRRGGWARPAPWVWLVAWMLFLPNSFYLVTDVSHLFTRTYGLDQMYAVALFGLFGVIGIAIGLHSVLMVHRAVRKRVGGRTAYFAAELALLLSGLGIYLGHVLRLNTWDVILHPFSLWQDVAFGVVNMGVSGLTLIFTFFLLLSGLYAIYYQTIFGTPAYLEKIDF